MDTSILISLAVPVFFLMIGIELVYGYASGKNNYRLNDSVAAISLGLISRIPPMLNLGVQGIVWTSIATNYNLQLLPSIIHVQCAESVPKGPCFTSPSGFIAQ